ncbi:MAG TPA: hypothetical protein PLK08_08685 [Phycisphaerae bacterium]|nr:hypothetical protein [Phycisphaerae bacterium]
MTVEGYKCQSCKYEFTDENAGVIMTSRASWDSAGGCPAEYEACCPNCGKIVDDGDAADIEVEEW